MAPSIMFPHPPPSSDENKMKITRSSPPPSYSGIFGSIDPFSIYKMNVKFLGPEYIARAKVMLRASIQGYRYRLRQYHEENMKAILCRVESHKAFLKFSKVKSLGIKRFCGLKKRKMQSNIKLKKGQANTMKPHQLINTQTINEDLYSQDFHKNGQAMRIEKLKLAQNLPAKSKTISKSHKSQNRKKWVRHLVNSYVLKSIGRVKSLQKIEQKEFRLTSIIFKFKHGLRRPSLSEKWKLQRCVDEEITRQKSEETGKVLLPGMVEKISKSAEKYWHRRYTLFWRFDEGVKMDEEGLFSVTPEVIARHQASHCGSGIVVVDAFTGVGGNAIQFAAMNAHVIAIDICPKRIEYARHNAKIYGVEDKINFIVGDFFQIAPTLKADVIFLSPPWGGPDYIQAQKYDIRTMLQPNDGILLFKTALKVAPSVAIFLPRTVDRAQLSELSHICDPPLAFEIEENFVDTELKAITAYYGEIASTCSRDSTGASLESLENNGGKSEMGASCASLGSLANNGGKSEMGSSCVSLESLANNGGKSEMGSSCVSLESLANNGGKSEMGSSCVSLESLANNGGKSEMGSSCVSLESLANNGGENEMGSSCASLESLTNNGGNNEMGSSCVSLESVEINEGKSEIVSLCSRASTSVSLEGMKKNIGKSEMASTCPKASSFGVWRKLKIMEEKVK